MINRTMVRTRVVQTLFAFYNDPDKTVTSARKELRKPTRMISISCYWIS